MKLQTSFTGGRGVKGKDGERMVRELGNRHVPTAILKMGNRQGTTV